MNAGQHLGLGTVQFGRDYGITNKAGQVSEEEAGAILALAAERGIDTIDTARLYGDSENVIGRRAPAAGFRIVTKTPRFGDVSADEAVAQLGAAFGTSLEALQRYSIHALLLHDVNDLLGPLGSALWSSLEELKSSGRVSNIGVSVYEPHEVDRVLEEYSIDIIQLPFNAVDARLVEGGQLDRLKLSGVEIHARSIFLQGLLLARSEDIPTRFAPIRSALEQLDRVFDDRGLSRLEGLLALMFEHSQVDRFIVGVTSREELQAILAAAERAREAGMPLVGLPAIDPRYLNPARWHELT